MDDYREIRLRNLEATIADLRRERREDRELIKEILSQVLMLTDKQTGLLEQWTSIMAERRRALRVEGKPRTYTLTPEEEFRLWAEKNRPELLESDAEPDYGVHGAEDSAVRNLDS